MEKPEPKPSYEEISSTLTHFKEPLISLDAYTVNGMKVGATVEFQVPIPTGGEETICGEMIAFTESGWIYVDRKAIVYLKKGPTARHKYYKIRHELIREVRDERRTDGPA